ncbi:MAG TPA: hypothetical protein QGF95_27150 [Candidatus Latescibacteria bacterium]|nr:hypothetical protein [Candidatus Latescibacterota bacterium]
MSCLLPHRRRLAGILLLGLYAGLLVQLPSAHLSPAAAADACPCSTDVCQCPVPEAVAGASSGACLVAAGCHAEDVQLILQYAAFPEHLLAVTTGPPHPAPVDLSPGRLHLTTLSVQLDGPDKVPR